LVWKRDWYIDYETRNEKVVGKTGFKDKWLEANGKDKVIDKRKLSKGSAGSTPVKDEEAPF